jgi:anti-sigma B factor antagonist
MRIESHLKDGILFIKPIEKRIDASRAIDFKTQLKKLLQDGNNKLIMNLSEVDFIDSSGLGALVAIYKTISEKGKMTLCEVKKGVKSILELTHLDEYIEVHHSEEEAFDSMVNPE